MNALTLTDAHALVGPDLEELPAATIDVRDGKIVRVARGEPGPDAISLDGAFVVPGLVDCHVHFDINAKVDAYPYWRAPALDRSLTCAHNGLRALRSGITTLRDLGSTDYTTVRYAQLTAAGELLGPRVVAAGRFIAMTGGHMYEYGREADGVDDVRRAAREQIRAGAKVIKVMATGGLSTAGSPQAAELTREELAAAADEAHKAGLRIAAHAHSPAGITAAIEAGCDTIEHGAYLDGACIELLKSTATPLVPTIGALRHFHEGCGVPPDTLEKSLAALPEFRRNIHTAIAAGVVIAAGTDAGTAFNPIGDLLSELRLYRELGMSDLDALRSATVVAGAAVGIGTGVIEVGAPGDLLVLPSDPRQDIGALEAPVAVVLGGQMFTPEQLQRMAEPVAAFASWRPDPGDQGGRS